MSELDKETERFGNVVSDESNAKIETQNDFTADDMKETLNGLTKEFETFEEWFVWIMSRGVQVIPISDELSISKNPILYVPKAMLERMPKEPTTKEKKP